jgi:hypothetical protein
MSNFSSACSAVTAVKAVMSQATLRMIYFSYVQSIMTYSIIIRGNLPYGIHIFMIKKE